MTLSEFFGPSDILRVLDYLRCQDWYVKPRKMQNELNISEVRLRNTLRILTEKEFVERDREFGVRLTEQAVICYNLTQQIWKKAGESSVKRPINGSQTF